MLLAPKFVKYKKAFSRKKTKLQKTIFSDFTLGEQALISKESGRINSRQIESTRKFLRRILKKEAKTWINIFPQVPITKKPQEIRMGKGKANVKYWVSLIQKSKVFFEIKGFKQQLIEKTLSSAKIKLPIKTKTITRN